MGRTLFVNICKKSKPPALQKQAHFAAIRGFVEQLADRLLEYRMDCPGGDLGERHEHETTLGDAGMRDSRPRS